MPWRTKTLVVADDLTGAADSGVAFALRGMRTEIYFGTHFDDAAVVVTDTDSRYLTAEAAGASVRAVLNRHAADRIVFKKIDSTLRGNIVAELDAMDGPVVVCPAAPSTGRTVVDGIVHIDGIPLHETEAWATETRPAPRSVAAALEPLPVRTVGLRTVRDDPPALRAALEGGGVVVCDAVTDADLRVIAESCLAANARLAGAAGLAHALADCLAPLAPTEPPVVRGRALAVFGSANPVSREQAQCLARGFANHLVLPVSDVLAPSVRPRIATRLRELTLSGDTVVSLSGTAADPKQLSDMLGCLVAEAAQVAGLLVLTGGETARSVLTSLGVSRLRLLTELEPGVVLGTAAELHVITKAGGFGNVSTLDTAVQRARRAER